MATGECPIAAAVFLDDELIAENFTREFSERRLLVHAELNALLDADLKRHTFAERRRMQLFTNLEPCMMCLGAAMSFFIGEVYYALESPSDGAVTVAREWNPQSEDMAAYRLPKITGGLLRQESQALFGRYAEQCPPGGLKDFALSLARL
jgi:tRNA(adenine34) deaminase